jgi:ketosteroid isomerase-like protein
MKKVDLEADRKILKYLHEHMLVDEKSDVDDVMSHIAEEAVLIPSKGRPITGAKAIRDAVKEMVKTNVLSMSGGVTTLEIASSGDLAYDIGKFKIVNQGPKGPVTEEGHFVTLYKKIGGEWMFMGQIWNSV